MHPGGVRTAMALFFFYKVSFEKHPNGQYSGKGKGQVWSE